MLQEDLKDYVEKSVPVHQANFDKLMKEMNLNLTPIQVKPKSNVKDLLNSKKCDGICKSDKLIENIKATFEHIKSNNNKKKNFQETTKSMPSQALTNKSNENDKSDEDDGDLVFDLKFDRIKTVIDNSEPATSSIAPINHFVLPKLPSTATVPRIPDCLKLPCKASKFVSSYRTITSVKRKAEEMDSDNEDNEGKRIDFPSKQNYQPNPLSSSNESLERKTDFQTGSDELQNQYAKRYGNGNTDSSKAYAGGKRLGARVGRTVHSKFVSPIQNQQNANHNYCDNQRNYVNDDNTKINRDNDEPKSDMTNTSDDIRLRNIDANMIERIQNEIMHQHAEIGKQYIFIEYV